MSASGLPRLSVIGDDYVFVELAEDMALEISLRVMRMAQDLREARIPEILEICPGNVSLLVRFDSRVSEPGIVVAALQTALDRDSTLPGALQTRVVEIPVLYQDPWTSELVERSRELNHRPEMTDLEFAAHCNGLDSPEEFIQAHAGTPYIVTMIGFVAGAAWYYQLVSPEDQLEVPKYLQPRTETPERAVGQGGAFSAVYPVSGAGGYQLYGRTPVPVLDTELRLPAFRESMTLLRPGDIVRFRKIGMGEYKDIESEVMAGTYCHLIASDVEVELERLMADPADVSRALVAAALP